MAAARMALDGKNRCALQVALRRLRDEIIELYLDWREEAALVADAYAAWADAPADEQGWCFAAYSAAIDREDAAARRYADMVSNGERLSHRWRAR
jgi:hypothetical protein